MTYFGGKAAPGVPQTLASWIPHHQIYLEAFLGHAALMLHKRPALINIGIDLNSHALLHSRTAISQLNIPPQHQFSFARANAITVLEAHHLTPDWFIFCDPPYPLETRTSNHRYQNDLTTPDHERLLSALTKSHAKILLTSIWNTLYADTLRGWYVRQYQNQTHAGITTETAWMNYQPPTHAPYAPEPGQGYRQREAMRKQRKRWTQKFAKMPPDQRQAILNALLQTLRSAPPQP